MIKKLCSYPGCHKVVEAGVKYCDKHRETDRKKYREYKQRRMKDEQEARRQQFYNSKAWEAYGYEGVRQKGSHKQYLNKETGDLTTIKQESPLKKAYIVDILNRIGE